MEQHIKTRQTITRNQSVFCSIRIFLRPLSFEGLSLRMSVQNSPEKYENERKNSAIQNSPMQNSPKTSPN